jgi:hypothetical protein
MGILQRGADVFYTFRFIKLLVTRWTDTKAFKLGIIDKDGKPTKKVAELTTNEEKSAYTMFHRLVYNLKRLLNKVPLVGKSTLASWAAAIWLIKEETGMNDNSVKSLLEKYSKDNGLDFEFGNTLLENNTWLTESTGELRKGSYILLDDIQSPKTGEVIAKAGSTVNVKESTAPVGSVFGANIYQVDHVSTKQHIYISTGNIVR